MGATLPIEKNFVSTAYIGTITSFHNLVHALEVSRVKFVTVQGDDHRKKTHKYFHIAHYIHKIKHSHST